PTPASTWRTGPRSSRASRRTRPRPSARSWRSAHLPSATGDTRSGPVRALSSPGMETIVVERDAGIVTVTLNRPEKKNAIDQAMWDELLQTFEAVRRRTEDRVLVLTGAGGAFCSGADLSDAAAGGEHQLVHMRHV